MMIFRVVEVGADRDSQQRSGSTKISKDQDSQQVDLAHVMLRRSLATFQLIAQILEVSNYSIIRSIID
jgi:hypothetical protein